MFLIASAAAGLLIALIVVLSLAAIVLAVMIVINFLKLSKGDAERAKDKPATKAKAEKPVAVASTKAADKSADKKEKAPKKASKQAEPEPQPAPYGSKKIQPTEQPAPYGSAAGATAYGASTASYGGSAYGDTQPVRQAEAWESESGFVPYGSKKVTPKLQQIPIELPKDNWGSKSLFERINSLSYAQKILYERAKVILKSRLLNYTTDICEVYFNGEQPAARLIIYKTQVLLFLAIDPSGVSKDKFHIKDVSKIEDYKNLPTLLLLANLDQVNGVEVLLDKLITG